MMRRACNTREAIQLTVIKLPQPLLERSKIEMALLPRIEGFPQRFHARILGVCGFDVHLLQYRVLLSFVYHGWNWRRTKEGESKGAMGDELKAQW